MAGTGLPFRLLDVFAERRNQGNQLLVLLDAEASLSAAQVSDGD